MSLSKWVKTNILNIGKIIWNKATKMKSVSLAPFPRLLTRERNWKHNSLNVSMNMKICFVISSTLIWSYLPQYYSYYGWLFEEEFWRGCQEAIGRSSAPMAIRRLARQEPPPPLPYGRWSRQARRGRAQTPQNPGIYLSLDIE